MSNEYLDWLADNLLDPEEKEQSKDKELNMRVLGETTIKYHPDEICPVCGSYSYNGDVCNLCKRDYDLEDKKETYGL